MPHQKEGVAMKTFFALLIGLSALTAHADNNFDNKLKELISFVESWTSYSYNNEVLPEVVKLNHDWLQIYYYGDYKVAQAEYMGTELPAVNAYYSRDENKIYISDHIPMNSRQMDSTLVHELVHYLQEVSGYTESIEGRLVCTESEAYDVQMLWQLENDFQTENLDLLKERALMSATMCMGSQFPSR